MSEECLGSVTGGYYVQLYVVVAMKVKLNLITEMFLDFENRFFPHFPWRH